jgi:sugar lactone lactonase YvrE
MSIRAMISRALVCGASGACFSPTPSIAAQDCSAQGAMTFICGIDAAEDSVAVPGTRWLIASGLGFGAANTLKRIDTASGRVEALYPAGAGNRLDARTYAACSGPPDPQSFSTGGLALRTVSRNRALLYAVHSGGRESIEVFEIDASGTVPAATWVGCIPMPERTDANAVTALRDGGVAIASMDDGSADRMARHVAGEALGSVYEWQPRSGLRQLPGVKLRGGNGIVESPDGRALFVSAWSGGEIVRIRRDGRAPPTSIKLDYLPDNLRWAADGSILVGGQRGPVSTIANCTGATCIDDWLVAKLDPRTLKSLSLIEGKGTPVVNYATGATELNGALYITNRGMGRIGVVRTKNLRTGAATRVTDSSD